MLRVVERSMEKELKENRIMRSWQVGNINKEIEITKRNNIEILELKSTITKRKISIRDFS